MTQKFSKEAVDKYYLEELDKFVDRQKSAQVSGFSAGLKDKRKADYKEYFKNKKAKANPVAITEDQQRATKAEDVNAKVAKIKAKIAKRKAAILESEQHNTNDSAKLKEFFKERLKKRMAEMK